ncbi:MAG: DNA translocase FtsK 4TM domain-containing protein [Pseudorhodobacter sp.]|nr:DNA translocase FtsK 4TM domain-containing protein [Pseudorhodobacter sp.]
MASYQARQRDPLVDPNTQAMLERRGRELLGLALITLALAFAAMLGSYSPDDPGWMAATDAPVHNLLGRFGAAVASTLMIIGGLGVWGIALVLAAWGLRHVLHQGEERALGRVVFAVIAVALASVFAATHAPGAGWPHSFGLGGLFGDTVLGALLGVAPVQAGLGLKLVSLLAGLAMLGLGLFVTGFDRHELRVIGRFLLLGLVVIYSGLMLLAGRAITGAARAVRALQDHQRQRRANAAAARVVAADWQLAGEPDGKHHSFLQPAPLRRASLQGTDDQPAAGWGRPASLRPEPPLQTGPHGSAAAPQEKRGLLARMPQLMRRVVDPALQKDDALVNSDADYADLPSEDRIKARISDVIRSRMRNGTPAIAPPLSPISAAIARREPAVTRARSPQPLIAETGRGIHLPPEPPVMAAAAAQGFRGADWLTETADPACDAMESETDADFETDFGPLPVMPSPRLMADARGVVQNVAKKSLAPSRQAVAEAQPRLRFDDPAPAYELPPLSLLSSPANVERHQLSVDALEENARMLENVLDDYGVKGEIVSVRPGPVVTMYELEPAPGLKASRVIGLADDIARSMSALSARVSTVPGRTVIGIELPNVHREKVVLREILSARDFGDTAMRLPLALGKDIGGEPVIANLAKMPHLLIAGTTGSGKSVAINTMILSLLYKLSPEECRLIMIDPKMLELSVYDGIPHLLSPVVTDPKKAVVALKWVVGEMEDRYRKLSRLGVRNIEGYNGRVREALAKDEMFKRTIQTGFDEDTGEPVFETDEYQPVTLPYIVVVVDEMADLMMVAGKEIEACIQRLAQMARASGIHLIMATQRPSVDVITGTIKANFPTRISFQVTSKIDSRTILGEQGAEQLLGMGDMLYMAGGAKITRIHGPFVSDEEVEEIVNHLKSYGPPEYMSGVVEGVEDDKADDIDLVLGLGGDGSDDALYDQAVAVVAKDRKCSTSYIQRKLGIGYNKAARLVEQMEENQVVSTANHVGKREILLPEH